MTWQEILRSVWDYVLPENGASGNSLRVLDLLGAIISYHMTLLIVLLL